MIKELIHQCQQKNYEAVNELIALFQPLIKKYAYRVGNEDSYNDLLADFIQTIKSESIGKIISEVDYVYIAYINKAVFNSFLRHRKLYERNQRSVPMSDLSEETLHRIEGQLAKEDNYSILNYSKIEELLTDREFIIIKMLHDENKTATEVAMHFGISRQAVNQMKLNALKKLRAEFR